MRVITIRQPWVSCIFHHGKSVENRSWAPPAALLGHRIAIHAGQTKPDLDLVEQLVAEGFGTVDDFMAAPRGVVVGTVVLAGAVERRDMTDDMRRWHVRGQVGWHLLEPRALRTPIRAKGKLGLWTLSPRQVDRVFENR
jgi:hypothetical protein